MSVKPNQQWLSDEVIKESSKDIHEGLSLINSIEQPIITVMGSSRVPEGHFYYEHCRKTCKTLGQKGYAILTGGGTGMMEAANKGAHDAGAVSIGIRSGLLGHEHPTDSSVYTHLLVADKLMFTRRFLLLTAPSALLMYPGGFGTDNESTEGLMLMQTGLVDKVPMIFLETSEDQFWTKNRERMRETMAPDYINEEDLDLMTIITIDEDGSFEEIEEALQ